MSQIDQFPSEHELNRPRTNVVTTEVMIEMFPTEETSVMTPTPTAKRPRSSWRKTGMFMVVALLACLTAEMGEGGADRSDEVKAVFLAAEHLVVPNAYAAAVEPLVPTAATTNTIISRTEVLEKTTETLKYMVTTGDTLSSIALRFCGKASLYTELKSVNNLASADVILAGEELAISCKEKTLRVKKEVPAPIAEIPVLQEDIVTEEVPNEVQSEPADTKVEVATPALNFTLATSYLESIPEKEVVVEVKSELMPTTKNLKKVLVEGVYSFSLPDANVAVGNHATFVNIEKYEDGRWKRKETVTVIEKSENGDVRLFFALQDDFEWRDESFVIFDQGDGNTIVMSYEELSGSRIASTKGLRLKKPRKEEYARLEFEFPEKPSKWSRAIQITKNVGVPTALTILAPGVSPAVKGVSLAISGARRFVNHKTNQAMQKAYEALQEGAVQQ